MSDDGSTFRTAELAQRVSGELRGDGDVVIAGINSLDAAQPDQITFIADDRHARRWGSSRAGAAVITEGLSPQPADDVRPLIIVENAELASITLLELFAPPPILPDIGVHQAAFVDPSATLGAQARVGPHVSVGAGCVIGDNVVLHTGVRVYAKTHIGEGSVIHGNTVIRERCMIGRRVVLHQNVSIGADGFGYRPSPDGRLVKVPQIGTVEIHDDVEIGSGTCVDRGKFGATVIGAGTKIDNLVQIAHNCRIGKRCIILAQAGLAGSVEVGDGAILGGQVAVKDHLKIGRNARVGPKSGLLEDVPDGASVLGTPATSSRETLRQWSAIRKLPDLLRGRLRPNEVGSAPRRPLESAERD